MLCFLCHLSFYRDFREQTRFQMLRAVMDLAEFSKAGSHPDLLLAFPAGCWSLSGIKWCSQHHRTTPILVFNSETGLKFFSIILSAFLFSFLSSDCVVLSHSQTWCYQSIPLGLPCWWLPIFYHTFSSSDSISILECESTALLVTLLLPGLAAQIQMDYCKPVNLWPQ